MRRRTPTAMDEMVAVTCNFCWQTFELPLPPEDERPCALDYDCEICCRPLLVRIEPDGAARVEVP